MSLYTIGDAARYETPEQGQINFGSTVALGTWTLLNPVLASIWIPVVFTVLSLIPFVNVVVWIITAVVITLLAISSPIWGVLLTFWFAVIAILLPFWPIYNLTIGLIVVIESVFGVREFCGSILASDIGYGTCY